MTKEEFLELQIGANPIDIGKVCEYPVTKKVSYLIQKYSISLETINTIATSLEIKNIKTEKSIISVSTYKKIEIVLKLLCDEDEI